MTIHELFHSYRDSADACFDPQFFSKERILRYAERARIAPDHTQMIAEFLNAADTALLRFMWQFYYFQFCTEEDFSLNPGIIDTIDMPSEAEAKFPGCLRAIVYLLAVDNLERWLDGKPLRRTEIIEGYFNRYRNMAELNRVSHNTPGFCRLTYFLYMYAKPAILRVGRLNFQYTKYKNYCEMYENAAGDRIFAALPNYTYNAHGLQEKDGFTPFYQSSDGILTAHIFDKDGKLSAEPQSYKLADLQLMLKPDDRVLTIHIPEGGPLLREDVLSSMREAEEIFTAYFPPHKAIVCQTWFLDPALRGEVIRDGSNMAAFADLFDIISGTDNDNHSIYEHIFKVKRQPLEALIPTNDFTRRILERAMRGEKLYWGYGVLKKSISDEFKQKR